MSVSVICSTNRKDNLEKILENFQRQNLKDKELIIILNYRNPDLLGIKNLLNKFTDIHIYSLLPNHSLGKCLNFGVLKSKYPIISKFDDDDYYGPKYLSNSIQYLDIHNVDVIGKSTTYIYFTEKNILGVKNFGYENKYVNRVEGSTLIFKKSLFDVVQFKDKNLGEDMEFCKDILDNGFKIYSGSREDYVNVRNNHLKHTWKIDNDKLLKSCIELGKTEDFISLLKRNEVFK